LNKHKQYYNDLVKNLQFNPSCINNSFIEKYRGNMKKECEANFVILYYILNKYVNIPNNKITYNINIAKFELMITIRDLLYKLNQNQ